MKTITIREAYDWLQLGEDLNQSEWDELCQFLQGKYDKLVEIKYQQLRFINLVGVIQLSTVRIEILPKLLINNESPEKNREALLNLLVVTKTFPVQIHESTFSQLAKVDLLQLIAQTFTQLLLKEMRKGVYKEYKLVQQNNLTLKGRLLVSEQVRKNAFVPVRAYCEYDQFQEDVLLNRILKRALTLVFPHLKNSHYKSSAMFILDMFKNVDERKFNTTDLAKVKFNRQNKRYENIFKIAKMILLQEMMTSKFDQHLSFGILFEMNALYESYIDRCLQYLSYEKKFNVFSQHDKKYLLMNIETGRGNIKLKPDFYLVGEKEELIIDTKWKTISLEERLLYNQGDIYQMYAYVTAYEKVKKCILLYPYMEETDYPIWKVPEKEKYIEIHTVRLTSFQDSVEDLRQLLTVFR